MNPPRSLSASVFSGSAAERKSFVCLKAGNTLPPHYALALVLHAVAHPAEGAAEADEFPNGFGEDCCDEEAADG